jgi:acyl transferase domain-containing protein/NADPH:quinone reductase-like Zn-dependent oxidoreductase/NADP-dependent 3-hydroxy acid dehydrogenase YdfG/acyl carrier protein/SAM-dependent methyltransferase
MSSKINEPIAIIGLGCRFPGGANSPEQYWELLRQGKDAIIEVPPDRWNVDTYYSPNPKAPGKTVSRWGGFIDSIQMFDARFFGISPREAAQMDPQQRILLECVWQALEDGGQVPDRLAGTPVGVFLGVSGWEYQSYLKLDLHCVEGQTVSGVALSVGANRISYNFDFKGPSLITDTACSSSLVAAHLACQSIWSGESTLAITGGVNAILVPDVTIGLGKGGMLSPDGQCKSFDAAGNGYVRGEGAGIAVLKPLQQALQDKDPIYAMILSTTSNQDGRTWAMPIPNGESQKAMMREACKKAGISPNEIQYLEAHGTGTLMGDPIEANAQGEVLSENRPPDEVCYMGSVKSNIGHLESASGIAGLMKVALALKHKAIPPNLHFKHPHPEIDFEALKLKVPEELVPWPENNGSALAGVNSFGFGGTNANIIVKEAPIQLEAETEGVDSGEPADLFLTLSARTPDALKDFAKRYIDFFSKKEDWTSRDLRDVCYTASMRRNHHDYRLAIAGQSVVDFVQGLQAFLNDEKHPGLSSGKIIATKNTKSLSSANNVVVASPKIVFLFSGQGPQWWGMGRQLMEKEPVFHAAIKKCDALFSQHADWSLLKELMADEEQSRINETHITQPALFALQVGLADLWRSWGIQPSAVIGHSIGEAAAAYTAGIYSLEEAVRIVFHRGRWLHKRVGKGKMAVVGLSERKAEEALKGWENEISLAAVNSPKSVTVSGDAGALEKMMEPLRQKEIFCRYLQVNYAFHSYQMDSVRKDLLKSLKDLPCKNSSIPFYSTVRGKVERGDQLGADYWWENVRNPVRFFKATEKLVQDGFTTFLELSPHPVLGANISECLSHLKQKGTVLPSLKHNEEDRKIMVNSLGTLYSQGHSIDWHSIFPNGGRCVSLPYYPWQRERYWHEREEKGYDPFAVDVHPFLGWEMEFSSSGWQCRLDKRDLIFLGDHIVKGLLIFPGAGFVEWALALAKHVKEGASCVIDSIEFHNALILPRNKSLKTQLAYDPSDASFKIHSLSDRTNQTWTLHASGTLADQFNPDNFENIDLQAIKNRCKEEVISKELYETFEKMGLIYGPAFQGIDKSWRGNGEALALLKKPKALGIDAKPYQIHPALLDAAFQVSALLALESEALTSKLFLPVSIDRVLFNGTPTHPLWVYVKAVEFSSGQAVVDLQMVDEEGKIWIECQGLHFRAVNPSRGRDLQNPDNWLYEWHWEPCSETVLSDAPLLPAPDQIVSSLNEDRDYLSEVNDCPRFYDSIEPQFNHLSALYVLSVFKKLAPGFESLTVFSTESLVEQFKLNSRHMAYVDNCLCILGKEGVLEREDTQWKIVSFPKQVEDPQEVWKSLIGKFPAYLAELNLLRLAGENLAGILKGEIEGLQTIFAEEDAVWERLQEGACSSRIYTLLLQKVISYLLDDLPEGRKLRILEIGGVAGGVNTPSILRKCSPDKVEYVFTDPSEDRVEKAGQKFREFSFVQSQMLDLESPPSTQEFAPRSFDLILGPHSNFGIEPSQKVLEHIAELLASQGLLLQLEWNTTCNWLRLILGACEFDSGKGENALFPWSGSGGWRQLLTETGFENVSQWGDVEDPCRSLQTFLLARGPKVSQADSTQENKISPPNKKGSWILFADGNGVGESLAESLRNFGESSFLVTPGTEFQAGEDGHIQLRPDSLEDMGDLIHFVRKKKPALRGIVHLWNLDSPETTDLSLSSLQQAETVGSLSVTQLINELANIKWTKAPQLFLATRGAQAVQSGEINISVAQSPAWGIGRVIQSEHSNFKCKIVDLDPAGSNPASVLFEELWRNDGEEEVAFRENQRFTYRLRRPEPKQTCVDSFVQDKKTETPAFVMDIGSPGILENFQLKAVERSRPGPGEVEIRVCAAGLNFRDVMIALGLLPGELEGVNHTWETLGLECSGVVTAVGEGVTDFQIGDEVAALSGGGCFGSHTIAPAFATAHKPKSISYEDAATIPVTFLTAWYMLHSAGKLQQGERILIHAASGGVGMAAVQIAQLAGAEVYATAGSDEKRGFIRDLGVKHIFDSRSLAFAEQIMEKTKGEGVDLVLNSLAGQFIFKSVEILKPLGRFLEIGKRDIYENNKMGLRPFLKGISFITMVDIKQGFESLGKEFRSIFMEIMHHMEKGDLHPLPHRIFSISNAVNAFRTMAQAKHMGKVVVSLEEPDLNLSLDEVYSTSFSADAAYLITGGLGGFGLATAKWMVGQGARHLALMGRSETPSEEAKTAIAIMEESGAEVRVVRGDVAQPEDVSRVLGEIETSLPPLKGIIHGAMVLDDGLLIHMTPQRIKRVMAPKVHGAWNLHQQTLDKKLDFFISFSSVANVVGNPGQANYVAANAFLESLAQYRRAQGLSGQVIHWGPLSGVGVAARQQGLIKRLESQGLMSITSRQAVEMLGRLMHKNPVEMGVFPVDWRKLLSLSRSGSNSPRYSYVLSDDAQGDPGGEMDGEVLIRPKLLAVPPEERAEILGEHLRQSIAKVLGLAPSKLEMDLPLTDAGLDSLMAMELIVRIETDLQITVPVVRFLGGPSINQMVPWLLEEMENQEDDEDGTDEEMSTTVSIN